VARSRAALRNTLTYLRSALDSDGGSRTSRPVFLVGIAPEADRGPRLVADHDYVSLCLYPDDYFDVDALRQAERALGGSDSKPPEQLFALLREVYAGDSREFLQGFSLDAIPAYDQWIVLQREINRRRIGRVFDRLSEHYLDSGDWVNALDVATRWVEHQPLDEAAYRRSMEIHLAAGDRAGVLAVYDTARTTLAAELGVEPAPETEALAARARILANAPERSPRPFRDLGTAANDLAPPPFLDAPLVGRESEFGALVEAFARTRRGQTEVVIVEGEGGIGKTRLATEFVGWSTVRGADVLEARAFEASGQLPYQALVPALGRRLDRENAPEDLLGNVWLAELSRLLPELRERYPDLPRWSAHDGAAQTRLFEAVARLGFALSERATLLLFVDDLQWADHATLDLLRYVARRWRERRAQALLLFTVRSEALAVSPTLASWLGDLGRDGPVTRIPLVSLSAADTRLLVEGIGVRESVTPFASWLYGETQGQPFYALESIRALVDRGVLIPRQQPDGSWSYVVAMAALETAGHAGVLPLSVRQIIGARLSKLSPAASDVLAASAVLGQHGEFAALCQTAGLGDDAGLRALDEALKLQLLRETPSTSDPGVPSVYAFAHDKIRDVVYTNAGDARRRVFHRRALAALRDTGVAAAELARHALAAGLGDDAFQYSLIAGEDALGLYATRDAIDHFQQALGVLSERQRTSTRASNDNPTELSRVEPLARLYLQLGRAFELASDRDKARWSYETLLGHAREAGLPSIECAALNRLATLTAQGGAGAAEATSLLREARAIAELRGDRLGVAETEWNLAQIGVYTLNPPMVFEHAERSLAIAREHGARELVARSMNVLAYASRNLGRWDQSEEYASQAATIYATLGNRALEVDSLGLVANSRIRNGQTQSGIRVGRQALAISDEIENPWGQIASAYHLVPGLLDAGLYADALAVASRGTSIARTQATRPMLVFSLVELGAAKRALLTLDEAAEIHREALALSQSLPALFVESSAAALCADYVLAGRWAEADDAARQALAVRNSALLLTGVTRWAETAALIRGGEAERAESDARHFAQQVKANHRYRIPSLRSLAVLAQAKGESALNIHYLDEARDLALEIGLPGELRSIDLALAEAFDVLGDVTSARDARGRAASIAASLADNIADETLRESFLAATRRWE
jgi:DNA-binding SARP family transcriptional activator